jgi:hypothetical protein
MFNLKGEVQKKMKPDYWSRGANYYNAGYVGDISIDQSSTDVSFYTHVL